MQAATMDIQFRPPDGQSQQWLQDQGLGDFVAPAERAIELSSAAAAGVELEATFKQLKNMYKYVKKKTWDSAKVSDALDGACKKLAALLSKPAVGSELHTMAQAALTRVFEITVAQVTNYLSPDENSNDTDSDSSEGSASSFDKAACAPRYADWVSNLSTALVEGDVNAINGRFGWTGEHYTFDRTELRWAVNLWNTIRSLGWVVCVGCHSGAIPSQ